MTSKPTQAKKRKVVNVCLLNGDEHSILVDVKSKFQEVYNQVTSLLCLRETEYFGLAFRKDDEYHFVVLDEKIHKLAPKQWKSGSGEGTDGQGKALVNLWFRVQFYVDQVILLREKVTRHQYYLQLKQNILQHNHLYNQDKCFQLAAYALQADFGNFIEERHQGGYFNPVLYFPQWMMDRHGVDYLSSNMPTIHKDLHNMTKNDAELRYIRHASTSPGAHNLHFYTVRKRKSDKVSDTWLAVCAKGVEVYEDDAGYKNHISTFLWRDIGKLYFDKKKFEIRSVQSAGGRRFVYYTNCDVKSKYLLTICRNTHIFQINIQPKLREIHHLDNEDQKRYRESYIYSDSRDKCSLKQSPSKSTRDSRTAGNQRYSVISDASSATTSGIVSDRMAVSFDDGDDHTREFMIDCPPRTPRERTPSQIKAKFQSAFNFPSSAKTSPRSSQHEVSSGLHEMSPSNSSGSWRARHTPVTARLMSLPSTPSQDTPGKSMRRSLGRKDSFSKHQILPPGSMILSSGERNTSGDSAVSLSGIFCSGVQDKLAPLSLPQSELRDYLNGSPVQTGSGALQSGARSSGSSSTYSLTPPLNLTHLKKSSAGPSPPNSLNFSTNSNSNSPRGGGGSVSASYSLGRRIQGSEFTSMGSPRDRSQKAYKLLPSPLDISDKLNSLSSPRANISEHYPKPVGSPRLENPDVSYKDIKGSKPLSSPRDRLSGPSTPRSLNEFSLTPSPRAETGYVFPTIPQPNSHLQQTGLSSSLPDDATQDSLLSDLHSSSVVEIQENTEHAILASLLQHQLQTTDLQPLTRNKTEPVASTSSVTDHYLMALQQGSAKLLGGPPSSPRGPPLAGMSILDNTDLALLNDHLRNELQQHQIQQDDGHLHHQQQMQQHDQILQQQQKQQHEQLVQHQHIQQHELLQQQIQQHDQLLKQQKIQQNDQYLQQQHQNQQIHLTQDLSLLNITEKDGLRNKEATQSETNVEPEENKENVCNIEAVDTGSPISEQASTESEDVIEVEGKRLKVNPAEVGSNGKGALHPELKQILGQSHAISLPLITALCNDSSLVQGSRSQSGSRSSYDTSTMRSTDSRLTRLSHDTDPRRWSSCCQGGGPTGTDTMLSVQTSRPYSWHSEHFDLDAHSSVHPRQLALLPPPSEEPHLPPTSPPNPRAAVLITNKHLTQADSSTWDAQLLPQKMIESDPGPSSPHAKSEYSFNISWWDEPKLENQRAPHHRLPHPGTSSLQHLQQHNPAQHMVPHKLSSGGHRDSDTSMSHKIMKENIGIA